MIAQIVGQLQFPDMTYIGRLIPAKDAIALLRIFAPGLIGTWREGFIGRCLYVQPDR